MAKKANTRAKRAAVKRPRKQPPTQTKLVDTTEAKPTKLSSVFKLTAKSLRVLWQHKALFAGVLALYALLNLIMVGATSLSLNLSEVRDQFGNRFVGGTAAYIQLLTGSLSASESAGVYQIFLALFVSLALIWTLRQVYAGQVVRIRDAYYKSMQPLIPYVLLIVLIGIQLLPFTIASALYQFVVLSGVAASMFEVILWFMVAVLGGLWSAYLATPTILALIIVTLPDMAPLQAYKLAKQITAKRRWTVLRKLAFMPLLLLVVTIVILLPLLIAAPTLAQLMLLVLAPILIAVGHSYVYALYRELADV